MPNRNAAVPDHAAAAANAAVPDNAFAVSDHLTAAASAAVPDHAAAAASAAGPDNAFAVSDHFTAAASAAVPDHAAAAANAAVPAVSDHFTAAANAAVPDNAFAVSDHFTFNFPDQGEVDFTFSPNDFVRIGGDGAYDDSTSPIEVEMTSVILSVPGTEHALPTNVLDNVVTALLDDWLV
jgi:hypothetical protein